MQQGPGNRAFSQRRCCAAVAAPRAPAAAARSYRSLALGGSVTRCMAEHPCIVVLQTTAVLQYSSTVVQ